MAGRKPKPTTLKLLHGNPGKRRINRHEPTPELGAPPRPSWLEELESPIAAETYAELAGILERMQVMTKADGKALELLADAYGLYREARRIIEEEGLTYESTSDSGGKMIRARPEIGIASDAAKRIRALLSEFGMTPSSRSRLHVGGQLPADPLGDFLSKKRSS